MATRRRTVEPELLSHPLFRKASFVAREVWIGLILQADDEGRLRLDPVTLGETIFSPMTHKITAKKIKEALDFWSTPWQADSPAWLLCYGDGYGFLTGWYEHQYIDPQAREESGLPEPPVAMNSWKSAEAVYSWYTGREGKRKSTYKMAFRAFLQLSVGDQEVILCQKLANSLPTDCKKLEGESESESESEKELENVSPPTPTEAPDQALPVGGDVAETEKPTAPETPTASTDTHAELRQALQSVYPKLSKPRLTAMATQFLGIIAEPDCAATERDLIEALYEAPPHHGSNPDAYMRFVQGRAAAGKTSRGQPAPADEGPVRPSASDLLNAVELTEAEQQAATEKAAGVTGEFLRRAAERKAASEQQPVLGAAGVAGGA